jgi:hypothetical protein
MLAGYPVSGFTGYTAGQSGIRLGTGYKKGRISGASLSKIIKK